MGSLKGAYRDNVWDELNEYIYIYIHIYIYIYMMFSLYLFCALSLSLSIYIGVCKCACCVFLISKDLLFALCFSSFDLNFAQHC